MLFSHPRKFISHFQIIVLNQIYPRRRTTRCQKCPTVTLVRHHQDMDAMPMSRWTDLPPARTHLLHPRQADSFAAIWKRLHASRSVISHLGCILRLTGTFSSVANEATTRTSVQIGTCQGTVEAWRGHEGSREAVVRLLVVVCIYFGPVACWAVLMKYRPSRKSESRPGSACMYDVTRRCTATCVCISSPPSRIRSIQRCTYGLAKHYHAWS
jgi:hypothetical protein